jgi:hypothetical protein
MKDLIDLLGAMASQRDKVPDRKDLLLDMGDRVVKKVASAFGVKGDEVAILLLTADSGHLRFIAPRRFIDLGTIPVTKRDSIAVNALARRTGEAINNVPMVKHVSFFESVKLRDRVVPIQKMITVPILLQGTAVGVAQVSRKGETPSEAGLDFTAADVKKAQDFFEAVASYLVQVLPDRF